ncbi:hypothetical protein V2A60_007507 [Cordyceps javanica]
MCTQGYRIVIYSCLDAERKNADLDICSDIGKEGHTTVERSLASAKRGYKCGRYDCRDPPKEQK